MKIHRLISLQIISCYLALARAEPTYYNYYPWRYNLSNYMTRNYYLPIAETLPEVIDNRARSALNLQLPVSSANFYPVYQFVQNGNEHQRDKLIAKNNISPEIVTNQVTVSEMSCQNNEDELYFR